MYYADLAVALLNPESVYGKNLFTGFIANLKGDRREDSLRGTDPLKSSLFLEWCSNIVHSCLLTFGVNLSGTSFTTVTL